MFVVSIPMNFKAKAPSLPVNFSKIGRKNLLPRRLDVTMGRASEDKAHTPGLRPWHRKVSTMAGGFQ